MKTEETKKEKRARLSWYFYDFGNSAYASIVLLAIFSTYFKNVVVGGVDGTRLWGLAVGIAAIVVAVISPVLGTIADFTKGKKKFLFFFTSLAVVFTVLLFFVRQGDVVLGIVFFTIAEIGYRAGQVFYDALLDDVSTPENIGAISGTGWAVGMLGGIVSLVVVMIPMQLMDNFFVPIAFIIAAVFFMLSSIPTFLWVKESASPESIPEGETVIGHGFKNLFATFKDARNYKEFIKYMISYLIYNDGIMMLMDFAAIIGGTLFGLDQTSLIVLVLILHVTGAIGALIFGKVADKSSGKQAILISLLILALSIIGIFFIPYELPIWFYVASGVAGFALSAAQAVSRSIVVQLAPADKITEFNGFLSTAGRTSTFIGPLVFSALSFRMNNWYVNAGYAANIAERMGMMWGMGAIVAFLAVGGLLLAFVKKIHIEHVEQEADN